MPHLVQIAERHGADGLQVLGVTDSGVEETLVFLDETGLPFPILADAGGVREAWQVGVIWGSPSYLVDQEDRIVGEEVLSLPAEQLAELLRR